MKKTSKFKEQPVNLARRIGAILYDSLLLLSILLIVTSLFVIFFRLTPENPFFIIYQAFIFVISFFFYSWFWTHGGQTLGMKTWKFKITSIDGSKVTWEKATIRFLMAIISILLLGLGFFWSILDKNNRTWHDIVSKTHLVRI